MLQRPHIPSGTYSSAEPAPASPIGAANENSLGTQSKAAVRLTTALAVYVTIEFVAVASSALLTAFLYHFFLRKSWSFNNFVSYTSAAIVIAILVLLISLAFKNFSAIRRQDRHRFLWSGIGAIALAFSIFLTVLFLTQVGELYSRATFVFQFVGTCTAICSARALFYSWLRSAIASGRIEARRVALIGDSAQCATFAERLKSSGILTVGLFRFPRHASPKRKRDGAQTIQELVGGLRSLPLDDIIVLADEAITHEMLNLTSSLADLPIGIHIVSVAALDALGSAQISQFGTLRTLQLYRPPLSTFDLFIKRLFDLFCATAGLIILSPLLMVVSIAIKLDSRGPILFRQVRHGFNNEEIKVLKFRSMSCMEDGRTFNQAVANDPRVTRIGRIIRSTNVDELPQLINVLRGEMSIVGPRPHATAHNSLFADLIAPFSRRHSVKPGITGWAQVNGYRGATDTFEKMQQRIEFDLQYIDHWSFLFDMKIVVMTIFSKRAYINAY
jgi:Undecaprenyl-phosphate glucose phosphotransferase